jgi:protein involved in polysaccharide export with SLBB domain
MKSIHHSLQSARYSCGTIAFAGMLTLMLLGCNNRRGWSTAGGRSESSNIATTSESASTPSDGNSSWGQDPAYPELPPPSALTDPRERRPTRSIPNEQPRVAQRQTIQDSNAPSTATSRRHPSTAGGSVNNNDLATLQPPPDDDREGTLRQKSDEQPLEVAKADTLPDDRIPNDDRSAPAARRSTPPTPETSTDTRPQPAAPRPAPALSVDGKYRLAVGDDLDLVFVESWAKGTEYRLLPGDEIRVEFVVGSDSTLSSKSPLDRTVRLQPDGMISLPYVGVVNASAMTIRELGQKLTGLYQDLYVNPSILVSLVATGGGLEELQRALQSAGGRTTRVAPDGNIMVPFLGAVRAENLELIELEEELNERFRRAAPGFGVMVRLAGRP